MKMAWQENGLVLTAFTLAAVGLFAASEHLVARRAQSPIVVAVEKLAEAEDEGEERAAQSAATPLYATLGELTARSRTELAAAHPEPAVLHELARQARGQDALALADELLARCLAIEPGRVEALFLRARTQSDLGNAREAADMYRRVVAAAPNHQKATYNLGVLARRSGDLAGAEQLLQRAAAISSGRVKAKALHQLGLVQGAAGRWTPAVQYLTASVNLRPDAYRVWLDLGNAQLKLGRPDAARAAVAKALALNARSADAHLAMGLLDERSGNRAAADGHFTRAVKLDGDNAEYRKALARHLLAGGDPAKARNTLDWIARNAEGEADRAYASAMLALLDRDNERMTRDIRRAEKLRPGAYDDAIERAALALHDQKRYAEARSLLDLLLARPSPSPEVLVVAARTAARLGRAGEAEGLVRRSLKAAPQNSEAWFQLGRLLSERGDTAGAIDAYRACLARNPGARNAELNLAVLHARSGNEAEALRLYGKILAAHPRYTPALLNRARIHERAGRDGLAIADLETALRVAPADAGIRDRLAQRLLKTGDTARARELLADAVAEAPADPGVRLLLAQTELRAGNRTDALRELHRAAALAGDDALVWERLSEGYRDAGDAKAAAAAGTRAKSLPAPAGTTP